MAVLNNKILHLFLVVIFTIIIYVLAHTMSYVENEPISGLLALLSAILLVNLLFGNKKV
jgi:hypothetical protein